METGYKRNKLFAKGGRVDKSKKLKDFITYGWKTKRDVLSSGDNYEIYRDENMTEDEVIKYYEERMRRGYDFAVQIYEKGKNGKQIYRSKSYDKTLDEFYDEEYAKGGTVEVDVESLQEELRSLKVRIKSLEEKNTSEAYEQSKKLRSQLSYIQARLLHLGVGSTSFAQGGTVGKYKVESNLYKPYKSDKFITYYYVVDENNKTINKNTGKIYRGKQMDNYKFSSREEAQKYADSLNKTQSKSGSTMKFSAVKCAEKLADIYFQAFEKLGYQSGGEIYQSDEKQRKLLAELQSLGIDKHIKSYTMEQRLKISDVLENENYHVLNNYFALKGFYGEDGRSQYVSLAKEYNKEGGNKYVLNPEIIKPNVSDISVYVPNRNILSITIEKDGKEMKLTGSDIMDGLYVKDGSFKRGGVIKTLRRWWKKLNGTWYYNEGNGWRRDRAFQNKTEDYEKGGRRTYKQVTRGYVDDTPYEYAKGGSVDDEAMYSYPDFFRSQGGIKFDTEQDAMNFIKGGAPFLRKALRTGEAVIVFDGEQFYIAEKVKYAKGGYVDIEGKLLKELQKLQRDLNSSRLQTYIEGDNSEEAMANKRERASKLARFNEVLAMLNDIQAKRKSEKFAKGGDVEIPEKIEYSSMFSPIPRSTDNEKVV